MLQASDVTPAPPPPRATVERFERGFDPARPADVPGAEVVGFGEISMVFRLDAHPGWVLKRVAGLASGEVAPYVELVRDYVAALEARGVSVAGVEAIEVERGGRPMVYLAQAALDPSLLAPRVARDADDAGFDALLEAVLGRAFAALDGGAPTERLGIDAQLSNWALAAPGAYGELVYLDVTTPMIRDQGRERLDVAFLLRALPAPLAWAMRVSDATRSMMDRYYDARTVALDVLANLVKEGCAERLPRALGVVNRLLEARGEAPWTLDEVRADYAADARMWAFLQWVKRPDRWLRRRMGRPYDWAIPPKLDRKMGESR